MNAKTVLFTALALALSPVFAAGATLPGLCSRFSTFDQDRDGVAEIERLELLPADLADSGKDGARVLVLIEQRLLSDDELRAALRRHAADLAAEGYRPALIGAQLYRGERHQDGRIVLALREFLRAVKQSDPSFAGAVLVGSFPEAYLVRTCSWRKKTKLTLNKGTDREKTFEQPVAYLRTVPEAVAHTCDLVLADLDGRWERLYTEQRERLPTVYGVFPDGVPEQGGITPDFERGGVVFEDFFHVNDGHLELRELLDADGRVSALHIIPRDDFADSECSDADRLLPNVIARPDILISRIDARGVALAPRPEFVDDAGRPAVITYADEKQVPSWSRAPFVSDPALERQLLLEYFERNHRYRTGRSRPARRPASIAHDLGSGYQVIRRAAGDWQDEQPALLDVKGRPDLTEVVTWLSRPALLRTLRAHSDRWGSSFEKSEKGDVGPLQELVGAEIWSWSRDRNRLKPSLQDACGKGKLDFFLLYSLWRNGTLPEQPAFWLHTGCEAISPPGAETRPYSHAEYGQRNGAQALLFFANGLALVGRAKVFYDEPRGFCEALAEGATFGAAWARYFDAESRAESWSEVGGDIGRKRSAFWSVLGDWTLRLDLTARD